MSDVREELAAGEVLFSKFLIRLREFARAQAEVVHCHLVVRSQAVTDLADHRHGDAAGGVKDAVEASLVEFKCGER